MKVERYSWQLIASFRKQLIQVLRNTYFTYPWHRLSAEPRVTGTGNSSWAVRKQNSASEKKTNACFVSVSDMALGFSYKSNLCFTSWGRVVDAGQSVGSASHDPALVPSSQSCGPPEAICVLWHHSLVTDDWSRSCLGWSNRVSLLGTWKRSAALFTDAINFNPEMVQQPSSSQSLKMGFCLPLTPVPTHRTECNSRGETQIKTRYQCLPLVPLSPLLPLYLWSISL